MALTISEFATGSTTTSVTSIDISSLTAAVGDMLIVAVSSDNSGSLGASPINTVTDSASNSYTSRVNVTRDPGAANEGVSLRVFTAVLSSALSSGTVTVNFSTATSNANVLIWRAQHNGTGTLSTATPGSNTSTGSGTTGSVAPIIGVPYAVVAFAATEAGGDFTADTDTLRGSWSSNYVSNTATETPLASQYKIVTEFGSQTYNPSWVNSTDYAIGAFSVVLNPTTSLYLPSTSATPAISPTPDAGWEKTSDNERILASKATTASAMTTVTAIKDVNNTAYDILRLQYIYGPLAAQTISGEVLGVMRVQESNGAADASTQMGIKVVSNDGSSVRGTALALSDDALAVEVSSLGLTSRFLPQGNNSEALTTVEAEAGDYLVIEIGMRGREASTTSRTFSWRIGDAAASDLSYNQTGTTDLRPFISFYGSSLDLTTYIAPGTASLTTTPFAPDVTVSGGGGSNATVTPGVATLTVTAHAPTATASDNKAATPTTANLTVTPQTPTVTAAPNQTVTLTEAALTLTTFAPTVTATANVALEPGSIAATLTAHSPAVSTSNNQVMAPATATLTLTAFAPLITLTGNQTVTSQAAALALVVFAPALILTAPSPGSATSRITATGSATQTLTAPEASLSLVATAEASLTLSSGGT